MNVGDPQWQEIVARLFGVEPVELTVAKDSFAVHGQSYPIDRGVVLLDSKTVDSAAPKGTGEDVRRSFSEEWQTYSSILPEHETEFAAYFDLVDLATLKTATVADLGCGSGRWSVKLAPSCHAIVLIDFSDAIFVAKENLRDVSNAVFFRGDVTDLPFANDCFDFQFSLGVLHHLERPCLPVAKELMRLSPETLFYLYYALDNRPTYYQVMLAMVTGVRRGLGKVHSEWARKQLARTIAVGVYRPMVGLGSLIERLGVKAPVPLYETYKNKSIDRIEQDAYDRFFTSIEQRVSRAQITNAFEGSFEVKFSESEPFWHFLVQRNRPHSKTPS
jgi:SAM-dependent methyltransferase